MALSQAFLEWEQATQQKARQEGQQEGRQEGRQEGQRSLILLLLEQRIGQLSQVQSDPLQVSLRDRISSLNLDQLQRLAIALLNFSSVSDLETWFSENS